jgi:dihydrofolate reductase
MTHLSLIAAMDKNRLIGSNNALPWHLPADLAFFKRTTLAKPIVMGRKTYESIGKPLPGRRNIVVTRNPSYEAPGCDVVAGVDEAMQLCASLPEIMLIGGASLYQQSIGLADSLYITKIHHTFQGDTWFPEYDEKAWKVELQEDFDPDERNSYAYSFVKFVRELKT